ncbi:hypothetical protein GQ600_26209 [Phytophthora cactorum]|nr:hypothetical protein GQ600_26209 [Phytophthora cactorum]
MEFIVLVAPGVLNGTTIYEIPADVVESFKTQFFCMLVDLEKSVRTVPHHKIRKNFVLINELLEGHCATWNPYNESDIGKLLATIQRFCSEEYGTEWNHSFMSICRACRKMNGSTFVWMADLASEPPKAFSRTWDELRFTDEAVVKESFVHVTSFEEQARHATKPSENGAGRKLVEVHEEHPVQSERHLEDMRLLMSVVVENFKGNLTAGEVKTAWKMLNTLLQLHDIYPLKTKGLHRYGKKSMCCEFAKPCS